MADDEAPPGYIPLLITGPSLISSLLSSDVSWSFWRLFWIIITGFDYQLGFRSNTSHYWMYYWWGRFSNCPKLPSSDWLRTIAFWKPKKHVTDEAPYKLIPKQVFLDDVQKRAAVSDFSPFKKEIANSELDDILGRFSNWCFASDWLIFKRHRFDWLTASSSQHQFENQL